MRVWLGSADAVTHCRASAKREMDTLADFSRFEFRTTAPKARLPTRRGTRRRLMLEAIELPAASANPAPESPHSGLTIGLVDREGEPTRAAVDRVVSFLGERLAEQAPIGTSSVESAPSKSPSAILVHRSCRDR